MLLTRIIYPPAGTDAARAVTGERRLPVLLRHAWYGLNQAFRRRIAHTGLTPDQYTVMRNLSEGERPGLTQRQLTERMGSDPNTMAALIERMEASGWIERRPHERDRRAQRIRLRPQGRRKYRQLRAQAHALQARVLSVLPASRRGRFLEELAAVARACRGAAEAKLQDPGAPGRRRRRGVGG